MKERKPKERQRKERERKKRSTRREGRESRAAEVEIPPNVTLQSLAVFFLPFFGNTWRSDLCGYADCLPPCSARIQPSRA